MKDEANYREQVYKIVRRIPRGRVMTYGQIAEILGEGYTARTVGYSMHASPDNTPWHRVINARGACSTGRIVLPEDKQQRLLVCRFVSNIISVPALSLSFRQNFRRFSGSTVGFLV